jgi:hypothetical protein
LVQSQLGQIVREILSRKTLHKKGLEWLKVKVLSSNPNTAKKKNGKLKIIKIKKIVKEVKRELMDVERTHAIIYPVRDL